MDSISNIIFGSYVSVGLVTLTFLILIYKICKVSQPKKKLPPGPRWALPLLGHLLQLGRKPHLTFSKWTTQYGPIFSLKIANMNAVVVGDAKLAKELYSKEESTGRVQNPIFDVHGARLGIGLTDGRNWAEQRAFSIKSLNSLSKGGTLEGILVEEGARLVKYLEERARAGLPVAANGLATPAIMNAIWRLLFGEDHDWTENPDLEHVKTLSQMTAAVNKMVGTGALFLPWLRHVIPEWCGYNNFLRASLQLKGATEGVINRSLGDPNSDNFIGQYLSQIERERDPQSSFFGELGKKNLFQTTSDLFGAVTDTTSATMDFALFYLSHHPQVQVKLQQEVDLVIGSRPPSLSDKLPYMEAVVQEILRKSSLFAIGLPHRALEDLEFHGYFIPKETMLLTDLHGILHDPEVYGDPHAFRPERWLNEDKSGLVRVDAFIPFLLGKRKCIGESMARSEMFLFLACIMQKFTFEPAESNKEQGVDLGDVVPGFFLKPKPFKVVFKLRG